MPAQTSAARFRSVLVASGAGIAAFRRRGAHALQKAAVLVQQGRLEEAEQQARLALADPDDARRRLFRPRHHPRSAEAARRRRRCSCRRRSSLEPRLVGAHLTLAQVYALQGRSAKALRCSAASSSSIRPMRSRGSRWRESRHGEAATTPVAGAAAPVHRSNQANRRRACSSWSTDLLKTGDRVSARDACARVGCASRPCRATLPEAGACAR